MLHHTMKATGLDMKLLQRQILSIHLQICWITLQCHNISRKDQRPLAVLEKLCNVHTNFTKVFNAGGLLQQGVMYILRGGYILHIISHLPTKQRQGSVQTAGYALEVNNKEQPG